jgi:hypothetical protein
MLVLLEFISQSFEEMGNYLLAITTETGEAGPKKPVAINGGFFEKKPGSTILKT